MIEAEASKNAGGRPRKSLAELEASGSWRGKARKKEGSTSKRPKVWDRKKIPDSAARDAAASIMLIPGYDPHRDSAGYRFDPESGLDAVRWIHRNITHVKGRLGGQGYRLTPMEQGIICNLFGWKAQKGGARRYRKCLIYVARKWGKTLFAASVTLYLLFECRGDGEDWEYTEEGVEAYCAAAAREQANILWSISKRIIQNDEFLSDRCRLYQHSIARIGPDDEQDSSFFQSISAEANTAHGFNPQVYALDEVHAQPDRELMDVLDTGTASRVEPLGLLLTTADYQRESICNEEHDYAVQVRDGVVEDPTYLPVVCKAEFEDDWADESTWLKANPKYPETPTREFMQIQCRKAKRSTPFLNTFRRLHLNIRTSVETQWIVLKQWDTMGEPFEWETLIGRPCYAGLDMSSNSDLTAYVLIFPEDDNAVLPFFWVPRGTLLKREEAQVLPSYLAWEQEGYLDVCEGQTIRDKQVFEKIVWSAEQFDLKQVAVDRFKANYIENEMEDAGIVFVPFGQGYQSMSMPTERLDTLQLEGDLRHGGHPILRWCAGNVMLETDNSPSENSKPVKAKTKNRQRNQYDNKIDGIVALVMAVGLAMLRDLPKPTVYRERGLVSV